MTGPRRNPIDDRLRAALRGLPLPEAPETLRHSLGTLPDRAMGEPTRRRPWSPGLAVAAVVLVATVGVAGLLGLTRIPANPGTSASPVSPEPAASVTVLDAAQLRAAIEAQRAGGLAPQWVVTSVGIDASRIPEPAARECSPQGSCAVIGVLDGFDDAAGAVTLRVDAEGVPPPATGSDLAGPVALRLAGEAPIEFLGHVDLAGGGGVLDAPALLATTDAAQDGHVVAVDGWLVGIDGFSCGPVADPALPPPFACDSMRALISAEPVKPIVESGNQRTTWIPDDAVRVQVGAYRMFALDAASDGTNDEPRRGVYLVRMVAYEAANCEGCRGWLMVGRLDTVGGTTTPPATAAPTSAVTLRSAQELQMLLAADRAAWIGRPVFVDGEIDPGFAVSCPGFVCVLGMLTGTTETVVASSYLASLLPSDTNGPMRGPMALVVRATGLEYLGWLGWSEPLGYETTVDDLTDLGSKPRGPMVTTVKGWLVAGLPVPCPPPLKPLGEDTPFDPCPPAWLTRDEVQPVTRTGDSISVREPETGVRVQYAAYGDFAPDPAWDPASGLAAPRYGTYIVRLVTDTRTGDADTGTKGWQVVGRLAREPELGPPDPATRPAPTGEPSPAATPGPTANPTVRPAATTSPRPAPSGAPPPETLVWIRSAALSADARTVTFDFVGGRPYDPANPCSKAYMGWAQIAGDTLYAAVADVTPVVPAVECTAEGYRRTVEVDLPEPYNGNRVQDLKGSVLLLRAPAGLAVLATLAGSWQLESEGNLEGGPNGRWHRTYTLAGAQEPGPGRLDLYQTFGAREIATGAHRTRSVSVNGGTADIYRDVASGELVVVWSLDGDGLALVANEADFTEAALLSLVESAVIPP